MTPPSPNQARFFVALLPPAALQSQVTAIKQEVWQNLPEQGGAEVSAPHYPAAAVSLASRRGGTTPNSI